ncbi:MAG: OmpA family protein [Rickettsiales bacterium]|jgi:outer membrane protein OmpA-like peptidoglycan-associated protein|nr:OmpA family protein [Rickettsiales bacterium]
MKKLLTIFFFVSLLVITTSGYAAATNNATMTVSGIIVDEDGIPLPGAYITAVGSNPSIGTTAGLDGEFTLDKFPADSTVKISHLGFKPETLSAITSNIGTIKLARDPIILNEVAVTVFIDGTPCPVVDLVEHPNAKGTLPTNAKSGTRNVRGDDIICNITECKTGFDHDKENNKCICDTSKDKEINAAGECVAKTPENTEEKKETPVSQPAATETPTTPAADPTTPALTEEQSAAKIDELRDNAQAMKDKERSLENRLLGAASMGATGIGGMNALSGMAEQSADEAAERDMAAYLATMRCDYGNGTQVAGGQTDVMLSNGNDLMPLYTEYVALANELKITKQALGLKAGIESETIIDKANAGLYDNAAIGKTSGAYTSVARALTDTTGADAAAWADQKSDAKSKTNTGLITAGAGIGIGVLGNLAINTANKDGNNIFGKKVATNQAKAINAKYASQIQKVKTTIAAVSDHKKPDVAAVVTKPVVVTLDLMQLAKDCKLDDLKEELKKACGATNDNTGNALTWAASGCNNSVLLLRQVLACGTLDVNWQNEFNLTALDYACSLREIKEHDKMVTALEAAGAKKADGQTCTEYKTEVAQKTVLAEIKSDVLFASGKYDLSPQGKTSLNSVANSLNEFESAITGGEKWGIEVRGYTDKDQPKPTAPYKTNQALSELRADAVVKYLESQGVASGRLVAVGKGEDGAKGTTKDTKAADRRIEFGEIQWLE